MKEVLKNRQKSIVFCLSSILICSLVFHFTTMKNILFKVYKWQMVQPETINGLIEIILVCLVLGGSVFLLNNKWTTNLAVLTSGVFLYLHGVLLPAIVCIIYFEVIMSVGRFTMTMVIKTKKYKDEYLTFFLIGFLIWSLVAIICSLFGFGSFNDLRIMTLILALISFIKGFNTPFVIYVFKKYSMLTTSEKLPASFLLLLILIQFAKSNTLLVYEFDSVWYGLRPEAVLVGENSFYDNLGLISYVHLYPKLLELFMIPLSNLGSYSYNISVNVMFFLLLIYLLTALFKELSSSKFVSLFYTAVIVSIPVVSNMASTSKTDIFSTFIFILGVYYIWKWVAGYKRIDDIGLNNNLWFAAISFVLSLGGKPTNMLYVPFVLVGLALYLFINKKDAKNLLRIKSFNLNLLLLFIFSVFVFFGICYRTYGITGVPIYPTFGNIWSMLGFEVKYPFILKNVGDIPTDSIHVADVLSRWFHLFFDPQIYGHVIMLWIGNIGLLLIVLFILLHVFKLKVIKRNSFLLIVFPICLVGIYYATILPNGGDSNFYLIPLVLGLVGLLRHTKFLLFEYKKILFITLALFIPLQSYIMFISHPSWSYGMSSININAQSINNTKQMKDKLFEYHGLTEIENYLKNSGNIEKCIGFGDDYLLNQLSCRMETINASANDYLGNSKLFSDPESFREFISWSKVKYLIIPNSEEPKDQPIFNLLNDIRKPSLKLGKVISGTKYDLIIIDPQIILNE
ncbi:hypothetical protein [Candidatus Pristimantibacillus sp. PTI5]|uniref:hypothetical protein n=1 Tax=Candidatus Pristimantibacillus sp. PTI5 TaxID=3400422 RepID=UPI003B0263F4